MKRLFIPITTLCFWFLSLALSPFLFVSCQQEGDEWNEVKTDDGRVALRISAGGHTAASRAAFADNTPVRVLAYARRNAAEEAYVNPAKIHTTEGVLRDTGGDLSVVEIQTLDESPCDELLVEADYTYDIVMVVNNSPAKTYMKPDGEGNFVAKPFYGTLSGSMLSGFGHGQDILAARTTVPVTSGTDAETVEVKFIGSDDTTPGCPDTKGNLPHLGSAVRVKATLHPDLLTNLDLASMKLGVQGVDFNNCLPVSANLPLPGGTAPMEYTVQTGGYNSSYSVEAKTETDVEVSKGSESTTEVLSGTGYLLPCPQQTGLVDVADGKNLMHLVFNLTLDGGGVSLTANNMELPPFKAGYRYTFVATFGEGISGSASDEIKLELEIEPWNSLSWYTAEGGYGDGSNDKVVITVGGWTGVTYETVEGGYGSTDEDKLKVSAGNFNTVNWSTQEGLY